MNIKCKKNLVMLIVFTILFSNISFYNHSFAQESEFKMTLKAGQSYELSNSSLSENYSIKRDSSVKYDEVIKRADGSISNYYKDRTYTNINILMGGKTIIRPSGDRDLNIWFPLEWKDKYITIKEVDEPVLSRQSLKAGHSYELSNKSLTNDYSLNRESSVKYDEVIKRADGSISSYYKDRTYTSISISKGGKTIIRPSEDRDLDIWFPYEWKDEYIIIKEVDEPALSRQTLKAGHSYELSNKSLTNDYSLNRESSVKYDEVIKRADGSISNYYKDRTYTNISISKGSKTIIKPSEDRDLEIWFPNEWKDEYIIIKEVDEPVLSRQTLKAGVSYEISNKSLTNDYSLNRESSVKCDISINRADGSNYSDRKDQTYTNLSILKGGNTIVRPSGERDLEIWFPYEFPITIKNQTTGATVFTGSTTKTEKPVDNKPIENPIPKENHLYDAEDPSDLIAIV